MAIIASDAFNRANTTGPDLGANWTNIAAGGFATNGFQIVSNHVEPTSLGSDKGAFWSGDVFPADQYSQVKVTVTGTGANAGVGPAVRMASDGTCYWAVVNKAASNNVVVGRKLAGTYATVGSGLRTTTWVDGDTLRLEVQGSTLRVYQNGVQLGADMTDTNIVSGPAGIAYSSSTTVAQVDDWEGGNFAAAGPGGTSNMMLMGVG